MNFKFNDGGTPFKSSRDCVVRSIAIVTDRSYEDTLADLKAFISDYADKKRDALARKLRASAYHRNPRNGVFSKITRAYMKSKGWKWVPTMSIGSGCRVHLDAAELPSGRLLVKVTNHITAVVDGVLNDTYDCTRGGTRCVYGYYMQP